MTPESRIGIVSELAGMMCTSHYWRNHRHVQEPLTAVHVARHVGDGQKYGLCPIKPGESTTRVALLDLDSHKGEVSWERMLTTARELRDLLVADGHRPQLWRSSGGQGVHVILTWNRAQAARDVRAYLAGVLEFCGLKNGTGGVAKGEVEVFPKQSEVPPDGFGSMFVLPWTCKSEPLE